MPLHQTITANPNTEVFVWKITESYEQLLSEVRLNDRNAARLLNMKSEMHRRGFLSVRKLLQETGYSDFDLYYDEFGKPHLHDGRHISITHSHEFSAIVYSGANIGIDMEKQREKILIIADKFTAPQEESYLDKNNVDDYIRKLTVIWGAKEAIFKIQNEIGISFKDHIKLLPFEIADKTATAILEFNGMEKHFTVNIVEIENFTLVYVTEK
ncbi:MAG TPA: 4'-phosphopantetheinyl transferase superfamily protein [Flavobacterium sp.]|nr:4'-phosphopantetheinyl transferase superfamily protein [Flavobacterium sp.]